VCSRIVQFDIAASEGRCFRRHHAGITYLHANLTSFLASPKLDMMVDDMGVRGEKRPRSALPAISSHGKPCPETQGMPFHHAGVDCVPKYII
jgi:hypothetical protein